MQARRSLNKGAWALLPAIGNWAAKPRLRLKLHGGGGSKANWMAMEVPYFDFYLNGKGEPLPLVSVRPSGDPLLASFTIASPHPLTKVEVYWAKVNPDVMKREWLALPATKTGDNAYEARLPAEAADWFAVASDDRPVTVSSDLIHRSMSGTK